jgi:hypothetical protein
MHKYLYLRAQRLKTKKIQTNKLPKIEKIQTNNLPFFEKIQRNNLISAIAKFATTDINS